MQKMTTDGEIHDDSSASVHFFIRGNLPRAYNF